MNSSYACYCYSCLVEIERGHLGGTCREAGEERCNGENLNITVCRKRRDQFICECVAGFDRKSLTCSE